jgi:hypothetical protein
MAEPAFFYAAAMCAKPWRYTGTMRCAFDAVFSGTAGVMCGDRREQCCKKPVRPVQAVTRVLFPAGGAGLSPPLPDQQVSGIAGLSICGIMQAKVSKSITVSDGFSDVVHSGNLLTLYGKNIQARRLLVRYAACNGWLLKAGGNQLMKIRALFACAVFAAGILVASAASAAVVNSWQYSYHIGFTDWEMSGRNGNVGYWGRQKIDGERAYTDLSWGSWEKRSSIKLTSYTWGNVDTDGDAAYATTMTHTNMPVTTDTLTSGRVKAELALWALDPYYGEKKALTTFLEFDFYETPNNGGLTSDVFILTNPGVTTEGFEYDGEWYTLDFSSSYGIIPDSYVEALKLDKSITYYGWLTPENSKTSVDSYFSISHRQQPTPAPEPATLGLMGMGILALGVYSRMKKKNA